MLRKIFIDQARNGELRMNVDLLNEFIWRSALYLVKEHSFFIVNNDDGVLTLRRSEGFVTTFLWLIPADQLSQKKIVRELDDTLTWMSAYRRKTPSMMFRSIHLFLYTQPITEQELRTISSHGTQSLIGRYRSSAWAVDLSRGTLYTPSLLLRSSRMIKHAIVQVIERMQHDKIDSSQLYTQITEWQREIERTQQQTQRGYQKHIRYSTGAPLTFGIAIINVIIWVLMTIFGGSQNPETLRLFGAKDNALIVSGEYWRFVTPMFLHIGGLHLWFNSTALLSLGGHVERIYGSVRFILIYILSGIFGTFASFVFTPAISAGASGAIFGLFGAILYFATKNPSAFGHTMGPGLISGLAINLVLGFIIPGIDNYAHLGGLIAGFVAAFLIGVPQPKKG